MHRFHHYFEDWINELACLFGITISQQLHGAFQVGKQNGDLLAFPLYHAFRMENLFSEVTRSVGVRRGKGRMVCRRCNRLSAREAEMCVSGQFRLTFATSKYEAY